MLTQSKCNDDTCLVNVTNEAKRENRNYFSPSALPEKTVLITTKQIKTSLERMKLTDI